MTDNAPSKVLQHKPQVAVIKEDACVGCTKCIPACPVDAIIGSEKQLHGILTHECIGCGLCIDPCPMDCITMVETPIPLFDPQLAKYRHQAKKQRLRDIKAAELAHQTATHHLSHAAKQQYILEALQRIKKA